MADPKTFTLIGEFKDGITPELAKINRQLTSLKNSFKNFGGKGARSASRDTGRFSAAVSSLNENLKTQNQSLRAAVAPMREYRREVGKTVGALERLNLAASGAKGIEATNDALRTQIRLQKELRSASMYAQGPRRRTAPGVGSVGSMGRPAVAGGRGSRGHGGVTGGGFSMAEFGFSYTLGNAIAQPIQNAITTGFEIGVGLMMKPFEYFAGAFGERVQDELSDLKAAGGLFSISKRSKNPFLKDIDEAIEFQQETNRAFAEMAGSLPGVTNDYVQVGKRLSDTIARIVSQDFEKAKERAIEIRSTAEGKKFYGGEITGDMATQQREVMKTLLGEMTKKTTIAGLGGTRSAGGITGAYGLPGIMERIMSEDQVSMGKFQRYASIFSDPTIADALNRNIDKINATAANTVARNDAVNKLLDEIVTPELIEKLRTSFDGMQQELKAAFFDPDKGLFGLGRQFNDLGKKINKYGEYVDEFGNVVDDVNKAAPASLSIFEMVRDIFANFGQALIPIVDILPQVFDPLRNIGRILAEVRHYAAEFNRQFNYYRQGFIDLGKTPGMEFLKGTEDIRATLLTIANFMRDFGVIGEGDFTRVRDLLKTQNANFPKILSGLIDTLMNSEMASEIGSRIGQIIGTVLVEVAKVTGFISGRITSSNKLFAGIKKGFDDVGGAKAFENIFKDVFNSLIKVMFEVLKVIPLQAYILGGIMLAMPALVQGLAMWLSTSLLKIPGILMSSGMSGLLARGTAKGVVPTGAQAKSMGSAFLPSYGAGAAASLRKKALNFDIDGDGSTLSKGFYNLKKFFGTKGYSEPIGPTPRDQTGRAVGGGYLPSSPVKGAGARLAAGAAAVKGAVGPAALVMGGIDMAMRMGAGEDAGRALGGAAATTIGSTLGGILGQTLIPIPGVGAALGGVAGGIIGDKIFSAIAGPTAEQQKAANLQMQAALQQKQAAGMDTAGIDTEKAGGTFLFGKADEVSKRLSELGLSTNAAVRSFEGLYRLDQSKQAAAQQAAEALRVETEKLKALGRPQAEIADRVKGLKATYETAKGEAEASLTALNTAWSKLGPETSKVILDSFKSMPVGQVEAAIAERIRAARIHARLTTPKSGEPDAVGRAKGGLSDAISSEMRNKPAGSKLVIANSSETVIPAAGGYGMKNFLNQVTMAVASSNRSTLGGGGVTVNAPITIYQSEGQDSEQLAAAVIGRLREAVDNAQRTTFG
jgi:hypothetical protein